MDSNEAQKSALQALAPAAVTCTEATMIMTIKDGKLTEKAKSQKLNATFDSLTRLSQECGSNLKEQLQPEVQRQALALMWK